MSKNQTATKEKRWNRSRLRRLMVESLEDRRLFNVDWRNPVDSIDVDNDGSVSALDALAVVNYINANGAGSLANTRNPGRPFFDVDGDQGVTALDVLGVVNFINANGNGARTLSEDGNRLAAETVVTITLGQLRGTRNYQVKIDSQFDTTDKSTALEDLLAVYLVDPKTPTTTLLDRGTIGTTLFTLAGTQAEFIPGRVRWDGSILDIDLSDLSSSDTGLLRFQLLNNDADTNTKITIQPLTNLVDRDGTTSERLPLPSPPTGSGPATNLANLTPVKNGQIEVRNVRFDSASNIYTAELRMRNDGDPLGRDIAVAFNGLTTGVVLRNSFGTTPQGAPYINLRPSVPRGGLTEGLWTDPVLIEFNNPGRLPFAIKPTLLAANNRAPTLAALPPITVMLGGVSSVPLVAQDPDGDSITYSLVNRSDRTLPNVTMGAMGVLTVRPSTSHLGTYEFDVIASDGVLEATRSVSLNVVADPITTTRVSGKILQVNGLPLASMPIQIGSVQGLTLADGSFTLDLGTGTVVSDTIKVRGELFAGPKMYPFIAEKLAFILGHEVYANVNNVIDRPIYLPEIDIANGKTIDPTKHTTVTSSALPGAKVEVAASTLMNQQGTPFTGVLSMTEVPVEFTPAALPEGLNADLVVTIQPGEMVFTVPTQLSLPNRGGYAPGAPMDLWSINPVTGEFDKVGIGKVSADGTTIDTVNGGIRNSSWHFFGPPAPTGPKDKDDPRNKKPEGCPLVEGATSSCEMHSGALMETHDLVTYQSQGISRGLTLTYDSLRADPRPIVHFTFDELAPNLYSVPSAVRLAAELEVTRNGVTTQVPGFTGNAYGLDRNTHIWRLPLQAGTVDAALQVDLRDQPTGLYDYRLQSGMLGYAGSRGFIGTLNETFGQVISVNTIQSPLGAGWGIDGLLEIVEHIDGSALVINGDGSELHYTRKSDGTYQHPPGVFSTLIKLPNGTFRRTWPNQTVEQYNPSRRIVSVTDRNGNIERYDYDGDGRFVKYTDPVGLETRLVYTGSQIEIIDPANRTTKLNLDAKGNLTRVTDPDGTTRQWRYDSQHHMVGEIDQLGSTETANYGFHGRITDVVRKDGSTRQYFPIDVQGLFPAEQTSADPIASPHSNPIAGRVPLPNSAFTDTNGNVTRSKLDERGQVVASSDNLGSLPSVTRNSDNLPILTTDALGNQKRFTYDANGNVLTSATDLLADNALQNLFGDAMTFDGVDDHVQVEDTPALRPVNVTIESWVRFASVPSIVILVGKTVGTSTHDSYNIWYQGGELRGFISDGGQHNYIGTPWRPEIGRWYHVAYTFDDASNTQSLYINGANVATGLQTVSIAYDNHPFLIGREIDDERLQYPFHGSMDEVRLWNYARSPEELRRDADRTLTGNETGLIAYYQFDNTATNQVIDSSLNQLHGTMPANDPSYISPSVTAARTVNAPNGLVGWWTGDGYANDIVASNNGYLANGAGFRPGIVGLAYSFDDQRNDVLVVPDAPDGSLDITGDLSINAWINPSSINGAFRTIVQKSPTGFSTDTTYDFYLEQDRLAFFSRKGNNHEAGERVFSEATIPLNSWTHVAAVVGNGSVQFFINGVRDSVRQYPFARSANNGPLTIGANPADFGTVNNPFVGGIDEVQLYSRALASGEILSIYNARHAGLTKPILYDATSEFSLQSNPNGVWSYGYSTEQNPAFKASTQFVDNGQVLDWRGTDNGPFVLRPRNRVTQGYYTLQNPPPPPDVMNLDPSFDARNSVVQWTAPVAGTYRFNGRFEGIDRVTTRVSVILNDDASSPFLTSVLNGLGSKKHFGFTRTMAAGDRMQFTVNTDGDFRFDGTGLSLTVIQEGTLPSGGNGSGVETATTTYSYDSVYNQATSIVDELGRKTKMFVDPNNGNTLLVTNIIGDEGGGDDIVTEYTYMPSGQVHTMTDPLGRVTQSTYDVLGRLTRIRRAFGTSSETSEQFQYDSAGRITTHIDENGNRTAFTYDAMNRLISTTLPDGSVSTVTYDKRGNLLTSTNPLGQTESIVFDSLDRVIRHTDAAGAVTRYIYDASGNRTSVIDPLNNVTRSRYDARRRPVATIDETGNETRYRYNAKDQLVSVIDARGNTTTISFDSRGNQIKRVDPFGKATTYLYDKNQQLIEERDRAGRKIEYRYNDLGDLISETWKSADGTVANTIQYSHNVLGQLLQATDDASSTTYTRDALNRVVQETTTGPNGLPTSQLSFTYDAIGNLLTQSDVINGVAGATNASTYDNRNRLSQLIQTGPGIQAKRVQFTYDSLSQTKSISRYADVAGQLLVGTSAFSHDSLNRLTSLTHRNAANAALNAFSFQYDADSRITQITNVDGVTNYAFNQRDELLSATHADPNNPDETYAYDATGNRVSSHLHSNRYTVGTGATNSPDANRLTSDGKYNYTYDANGNLSKRVEIATGAVREFTFDHRNRLIRVTDRVSASGVATQVVRFIYDIFNRRIASQVDSNPSDAIDGQINYFVYAGEDVIADLIDADGSGPATAAVSMRYLHGPSVDQILAQESASGEVIWMLTDHLGSVIDLIGNDGQIRNHIKYDSFGNVITESNPAIESRYKYTGREFDSETGLQYNRARYYDAAIGRFISEDPIGFAGDDANLYRYVGNSPVDSIDPSGNVRKQAKGESYFRGSITWLLKKMLKEDADISDIADKANKRNEDATKIGGENASDKDLEDAQEENEKAAAGKGHSNCPTPPPPPTFRKRKPAGKSKPTPFPELSLLDRLLMSNANKKLYENARKQNREAVAKGNVFAENAYFERL